MNQSGY